jgi:transposase-like protein
VILLAVGWYLRFSLSYRGVEELLAERGLEISFRVSGESDRVVALHLTRRLLHLIRGLISP